MRMAAALAAFLALATMAGAADFDPAWAQVLQRFVDEEGRVDFAGLRRDPRDLSRQVTFIARTSPEKDPAVFSTPAARLAYYLNAYNALAMERAARSGLEPRAKIRFFYLSRMTVGGRELSLHEFENEVIRPLGEPRVHFALNCMVRGCPRLRREPFHAARLESQLDGAAREFFNSPKNVEVDDSRRVVRFSSILKWYKKDFLARAPTLIAYANLYRAAAISDEYAVRFLDYDWTLNERPMPADPARP